MKQEAYITRHRAAELLNETISIWRQGDHSDQLEGLEKDPVFALLMTALAYQANETDSEIERFRQDVLEEYARLLVPYEAGRAIPATAIVETTLQKDVPEVELTEKSMFTLKGSSYQFMPLLRSRVINAKVGSVVRLDGRRWKLSLDFQEPVSDLSGMTFAIMDSRFRDVKVTMNDQLIKLVKPWHYANMPLQRCFSVESMLYNRAQMYQTAMTGLDLYARQNVALFYVEKNDIRQFMPVESEHIELVFDFTGIAEDFVFDKSHIALNVVLLVNAQLNTATLSATTPMVRVVGYSAAEGAARSNRQLMHLLPPSKEQLFGKTPVVVRRVAADRFNQAAMIRLVNSLTTKFHSDFYAFQNLADIDTRKVFSDIEAALTKLTNAVGREQQRDIAGVYMMLDRTAVANNPTLSLDIDYLTTDGSAINESLKTDSSFLPPAGLEADGIHQIALPVSGFDEVNNANSIQETTRYYMVTNDRIVTPADMKLFCYSELMNRYSIVPDMVSSITVKHLQMMERIECGYGIFVNICLQDNHFIRRSFADRIPQAEMLLQKMMEVRSANIYPIFVTIELKTETTA